MLNKRVRRTKVLDRKFYGLIAIVLILVAVLLIYFVAVFFEGKKAGEEILFAPAEVSGVELSQFIGQSNYPRGFDEILDVAEDGTGNVYVVGATKSCGLFDTDLGSAPAGTTGYGDLWAPGGNCFSTQLNRIDPVKTNNLFNVFVMKLADNGKTPIWVTMIGGSNDEHKAYAVEVDFNGIYIAGETTGNYPTTASAVQTNFGGGNKDGFITKLDSNGALVYSTFFGGLQDGYFRDIALGSASNLYLVMSDADTTFPPLPTTPVITPNAIYPTNHGTSKDYYIGKFDFNTNRIVYGSYYGGDGDEDGMPSIKVDKSDRLVLLGQTSSVGNANPAAGIPIPRRITEPGGTFIDNMFNCNGGGFFDIYLAKFNPDLTNIEFGTCFGDAAINTNLYSLNKQLAIYDSDGNGPEETYYISGETHLANIYIKDVNGNINTNALVYQNIANTPCTGNECRDVFVARIRDDGLANVKLEASTYFGGDKQDSIYGIDVDSSGNVFMTGTTLSDNFPISGYSVPTQLRRKLLLADSFIATLNKDLDASPYSSYINSREAIEARAGVISNTGEFVVGGTLNHILDSRFYLINEPSAILSGGHVGSNDAFVTSLSLSLCTNGQIRTCPVDCGGTALPGTQTCTNGVWGSCIPNNPSLCPSFCADFDSDGYSEVGGGNCCGTNANGVCNIGTASSADCNDNNRNVNPGKVEIYNPITNPNELLTCYGGIDDLGNPSANPKDSDEDCDALLPTGGNDWDTQTWNIAPVLGSSGTTARGDDQCLVGVNALLGYDEKPCQSVSGQISSVLALLYTSGPGFVDSISCQLEYGTGAPTVYPCGPLNWAPEWSAYDLKAADVYCPIPIGAVVGTQYTLRCLVDSAKSYAIPGENAKVSTNPITITEPTTCGLCLAQGLRGRCDYTLPAGGVCDGVKVCDTNFQWGTCAQNPPTTAEVCDGRDNNCDGQIDEGGVCPLTQYYCDYDGDGFLSSYVSGTCTGFECHVQTRCVLTSGPDCNDDRDPPGVTCPTSGACNAITASCAYCINNANGVESETLGNTCNDYEDNNCDGLTDAGRRWQDPLTANFVGAPGCPVGVSSASNAGGIVCPGGSLTATCVSTVAGAESVVSSIGIPGVSCGRLGYNNFDTSFNCVVASAAAFGSLQTITCDVDALLSTPASGVNAPPKTTTITLGTQAQCNPIAQCGDGLDNDGDGAIDFPADFSCSDVNDNDETNPMAQCQDGLDNDGDGYIDLLDVGCSRPQGFYSNQDNLEANCGDGRLNQPSFELCDDGNNVNGDGCSSICAVENGWSCTGGQTSPSVCGGICGDGQIVGNELCDGTSLGGASCTSIGQGYTGGVLACGANCLSYNTIGCTTSGGDCDIDNDLYGTIGSSGSCCGDGTQVCIGHNDCDDNPPNGGSVNPGVVETGAVMCLDGIDNDCDTREGYGMIWQQIGPNVQGDDGCLVSTTGVETFIGAQVVNDICPGDLVDTLCISNIPWMESVNAKIGNVGCNIYGWGGHPLTPFPYNQFDPTYGSFSCVTSTLNYGAQYNVLCDIDPALSAVGTTASKTLNVLSQAACNTCTFGTTPPQQCYTGPAGTLNVGVCREGTKTCDAQSQWGSCVGEVGPSAEVCNDNGVDNDCDGLADCSDISDCSGNAACQQGPSSSSSGSGGGGGGGGSSAIPTITATGITTNSLNEGGSYRFKVAKDRNAHTFKFVKLKDVGGVKTADISVTSTTKSASLKLGESAKIDTDDDGVDFDLMVIFSFLSGSKAKFTLSSLNELIGGAQVIQCNDGKDNDNDGKTDYPEDSGCENVLDNNEGAVVDDGGDDVKGDVDEENTIFGIEASRFVQIIVYVVLLSAIAAVFILIWRNMKRRNSIKESLSNLVKGSDNKISDNSKRWTNLWGLGNLFKRGDKINSFGSNTANKFPLKSDLK